MRAVVISDVHGEYDKMIAALDAVQFDKNNDILISNGDLIDRGPKVMECIKYVLDCPHHLIILGNHEYMFLETLLNPTKGFFTIQDYWNGEGATLQAIFDNYITSGWLSLYWDDKKYNHQILALAPILKYADKAAIQHLKDFFTYIEQGYKFIKLYNHQMESKYFITHGWPDVHITKKDATHEIGASWLLTSDCVKAFFIDALDKEDKIKTPLITSSANNTTIVVGHEWAFRLRYIAHYLKSHTITNDVDFWKAIRRAAPDGGFDPFGFEINCIDGDGQPSHNKVVMIDGCANFKNGKVNAFCIEDVEFIGVGESVVTREVNNRLKLSKYKTLKKLAK